MIPTANTTTTATVMIMPQGVWRWLTIDLGRLPGRPATFLAGPEPDLPAALLAADVAALGRFAPDFTVDGPLALPPAVFLPGWDGALRSAIDCLQDAPGTTPG